MSPVANAKKKRKGAANAGLQPVVEQQLGEDQPSPEQESEVNPSPDVDAGADEGDQGDHEGTPPPPPPSDGRVGTEEALRARALSSRRPVHQHQVHSGRPPLHSGRPRLHVGRPQLQPGERQVHSQGRPPVEAWDSRQRADADDGELRVGGEGDASHDSYANESGAELYGGPDLADAEMRAAVSYMTGTFRVPSLNPEAPDLWIDNVRDAMFSCGMAAVFEAADCRNKLDVPIRVRLAAERVPEWKLALAWPVIRRSLNSVPNVFAKTRRCRVPDVEGMVRAVLDAIQKRSQGAEARLRDEVAAANLADYPSLRAYVSDLETKFDKLAAHGVTMTDSEQRHLLLRGLTTDYNTIKASILSYRDRYDRPADLLTAISLLEDYEDNTLPVTTRTVHREVTLTTVGTKRTAVNENPKGVCFYYSKRGSCRRGDKCKFRHVERLVGQAGPKGAAGAQNSGRHLRKGACRKCGKKGHWEKECRQKKVEHTRVVIHNDWAMMSTNDFVGHGLGKTITYSAERWLVDSASTCVVANEKFGEFTNVQSAEVTITVGGKHNLECTQVGDLVVGGLGGSVHLKGVRIVPGFGANILSVPYLEKELGMTQSSDGTHWWARKDGKIILQGQADEADYNG